MVCSPGVDDLWYILDGEAPPHLEEHFNTIDEEKDNHDKHEAGVAAIEDMSIKFMVFILRPEENKFRNEE